MFRQCVITSTACNSKKSNAVVKWPASIYEAQIFLNSSINRMLTKRIIPPCGKIFAAGRNPVLVFLLGDPAYCLLQFLMKEFFGGRRNEMENFFSRKLPSAPIPVENPFQLFTIRYEC